MHIGKRIREVLSQQGHTVGWLAERIPCERSNVYNILRRESVDVGLLYSLSRALGHDFISELSDELARVQAAGE